MPVTIPPLPTIPPQPAANAAWELWDVYLRCVALALDAERIRSTDAQAAARLAQEKDYWEWQKAQAIVQKSMADARNEVLGRQATATDRHAAAAEAVNESMKAPPTFPRPSNEQLFMHYAGQRENAPFSDIPSKVRDFAVAMVTAHRAKYPSTPGGENAA